MAFETFADFVAMGKYGSYVWSVYGFSLFLLLALAWNTLVKRRKTQKMLVKRYLRKQML